jgi:hypothetical protein
VADLLNNRHVVADEKTGLAHLVLDVMQLL